MVRALGSRNKEPKKQKDGQESKIKDEKHPHPPINTHKHNKAILCTSYKRTYSVEDYYQVLAIIRRLHLMAVLQFLNTLGLYLIFLN